MVADAAARRISERVDASSITYAVANELSHRIMGSTDLSGAIAQAVAEQLAFRLLGEGWIDIDKLYDHIATKVAERIEQ